MNQLTYTIHSQTHPTTSHDDDSVAPLTIEVDSVSHEVTEGRYVVTGYYVKVYQRELDPDGLPYTAASKSPLCHTKKAAVSQLETVCSNLAVTPQPLPWQ